MFYDANNDLEWLPFINHWELVKNSWVDVLYPPNRGNARDIPSDAVLHESVLWRLKHDKSYLPKNNHGEGDAPCLRNLEDTTKIEKMTVAREKDLDHETFKFTKVVV